jgi:hypothetical protein
MSQVVWLGTDVRRYILSFLSCSDALLPEYFLVVVWPRLLAQWPTISLDRRDELATLFATHCARAERDALHRFRSKPLDYATSSQAWAVLKVYSDESAERMAKHTRPDADRPWCVFWLTAMERFFRVALAIKGVRGTFPHVPKYAPPCLFPNLKGACTSCSATPHATTRRVSMLMPRQASAPPSLHKNAAHWKT